jgi:hypothetical protein
MTKGNKIMKKIIVLLAVLLLSSNIWSFNPPSYIGKNIHDVLNELDGTQIYTNDERGDERYLIVIDDMRHIYLGIKSEIIVSVTYRRISYDSDGRVSRTLHRRIYERLINLHKENLPKPISSYDNGAEKLTQWRCPELGTYFINQAITDYFIGCDFPDGYGILESWTSHNYD